MENVLNKFRDFYNPIITSAYEQSSKNNKNSANDKQDNGAEYDSGSDSDTDSE